MAGGHAAGVAGRAAVLRAPAVLPVARRRVVLRHLLDLTEAQAAHELGVTVGTVESHNSRALKRLRETFDEGGPR